MAKGYEEIDESAIDRIITTIDTEDADYYQIRKNLVKRFPKWGGHRRDKFALRIVDRVIEDKEIKAGVVTKQTRQRYIKTAIDQATGIGGTTKARYKVVKTIDGKYLGRSGNIKITTRVGSKVYAKNTMTGRKGRIK